MNLTAAQANSHRNLSSNQLIEKALERGEGKLASNKALVVETGKRTGRSPKDRFIVRDQLTETSVDWGNVNQPVTLQTFEKLWQKAQHYMKGRETFSTKMAVAADQAYQITVEVTTDMAWHLLFCQNLFIRQPLGTDPQKNWTMLNASGLATDPKQDNVNSDAALMIDFTNRRILLCGLRYAGEMKKAMFSILNFLLPAQDVLPMHCAANVGAAGDVALFFGLSGTGKTTLSADPERFLIGDDEHGWSAKGIFNFEGGCYAKCINLSQEKEPVIWQAIRHGTVLENVTLDAKNGNPKYDDDTLSQNSRAAYPLEYVQKRIVANQAGHPQAVIFLSCDLYGVLPPVARLTHEQAAYYFLSGYTARVGSTEVGSTAGIEPTFSVCFGAPFFPRPARVYTDLLLRRLEQTKCPVYLVNTGWTGGGYGQGGKRFDIPVTRAIIRSIVSGELQKAEYTELPGFRFAMPKSLKGVDTNLLDPRKGWKNQVDYQTNAKKLIDNFRNNFKKFSVADKVVAAGPA